MRPESKVKLEEWSAHWQVERKVQEQEKPCESTDLRKQEEALGGYLRRAAAAYHGWEWTASTPRVPWDLSDESCGGILTLLHKVEMAGVWPRQCWYHPHFSDSSKAPPQKRPLALPTLVRRWEWLRALAVVWTARRAARATIGKRCWEMETNGL